MPEMPDVIVLCGGAGIRLRSVVGAAPKGMAVVAGRPFLEVLLRQLSRCHFERAILAVGYQRETIQSYFGETAFGMRLLYSVETSALGTAGALRNAAPLVASKTVLAMNGDSYTDLDLGKLAGEDRDPPADAGLVLVPADGRSDCGFVAVKPNGEVALFDEKNSSCRASYVNAGIYKFKVEMLYEIPAGREVSLEKEMLPQWLNEGKHIRGFVHAGQCLDIGTPERYQVAQTALAGVEAR